MLCLKGKSFFQLYFQYYIQFCSLSNSIQFCFCCSYFYLNFPSYFLFKYLTFFFFIIHSSFYHLVFFQSCWNVVHCYGKFFSEIPIILIECLENIREKCNLKSLNIRGNDWVVGAVLATSFCFSVILSMN